ncbi:uncharacterized protein BDZ99DRAFT_90413 [Mytilinidion resinicola]|uniref:BZIP domain-containing protein n=1 Tax=Mytilinidion resinicola TaxID=574789 RepID=A0A6A6YGL0_9PEZI|nr:uncharacterized protein BDZ99DRAFT_90413 [Mytilinidion resinicola]KAF2807037.1 hypothetical protein BDZ99DRAFT_90413 [Mytilinidion resinicola]
MYKPTSRCTTNSMMTSYYSSAWPVSNGYLPTSGAPYGMASQYPYESMATSSQGFSYASISSRQGSESSEGLSGSGPEAQPFAPSLQSPFQTMSNTTSATPERIDEQHACSVDGTVTEKRRERNRQSQRAFRERKEAKIRELEVKVKDLTKKSEDLESANSVLKTECNRLRALVGLLMGGDDRATREEPDDEQVKRATRLKRLLDLLEGVE